ncbi:MAG: hypothetical protein KatS3mg010_0289 [Acidimicrobiia bacterium]|nr:MAG: hypothetical protein KatS3mg010_0289 [Acidimicrobiia bacterium]
MARRSPLDARHRALGARMAPFGGWEMPIHYEGVLAEHRACRERAAVFDVSHLGTVVCDDPDAFALLQWLFTNDLGRIEPGRTQYTHLLDPDDAHVVDDVIVWWVGEHRFLVMPNASNTDRLVAAMREGVTRVDRAVAFTDVTGVACRARGAGAAGARALGEAVAGRGGGAAPGRAHGRRLDRRRYGVHRRGRRRDPRRGGRGRRAVGRVARRGRHAGRSRRARHAAARGRVAVARPRARPRHHAVAGRARVGGELGQGRLPGPRRPREARRTGASSGS